MFRLLFLSVLITLGLSACKDDKPKPTPAPKVYSYQIVFKELGKWVCIKEAYLKDANGNPVAPLSVECNHQYPNQCAYLFDGKDNVISKGTSLYVDVTTNKPVALVDADYWVSDICAVDPGITIQ